MKFRTPAVAVGLLALLLASGCGGVSSARKIDYRQTQTLPPLEVPPDLAELPDPNLPVARPDATAPGGATYSGYAGEQRTPGAVTVLPQFEDVRLVREGQARYVVVEADPGAVWQRVRQFLTDIGLAIASENPAAGLMETEWAENRAMIGARQGNALAAWFKSFFSTDLRDKYRVRLERGVAPGTTEIYLSHQGMEAVERDESGTESAPEAGWKPRPSDPELEAEMLQRLVLHLGGEPASETVIAQSAPPAGPAPADPAETGRAPADLAPEAPREPPNVRLTRNGDGAPLLALEDSLDRAWRRVGLSLDRIGFTVEDRDRSKGIYYVRYIDPDTQKEKPGFFSRLFRGEEPAARNQYQVHVKPAANGTNVEVLDTEGGPATSKTGERILSLLYEQLK